MLYIIYKKNHSSLEYQEGQESIIHLEADMHKTVDWAKQESLKWVFTDSNAGSDYFNYFYQLSDLKCIDWTAIKRRDWSSCRDKKQAEFLVEKYFPWQLIQYIGVYSDSIKDTVEGILNEVDPDHRPCIKVKKEWYY